MLQSVGPVIDYFLWDPAADLEERAMELWNKTDIVVFGHTHFPDLYEGENSKRYYNPGCWTQNIPVADEKLNYDDLIGKRALPYDLRYVEIWKDETTGTIESKQHTYRDFYPD
jgi:2',3'-cyclic-nucleotide 2'-phosphodiesterase (5'-nucleotidase family)